MKGADTRLARVSSDDRVGSLLHDLRQYVATGKMLFDDDEQLSDHDLRKRMRTGRLLFDQLSAMVAAAGEELTDTGPVDVGVVADETVTVFRLGHPALTVDTTYEPGLESRLDRNRLQRALTNVLENAAKASGPCGRISVEVWGEPSHVLVEVGDEGEGFGQVPRGTGHGMVAVGDLMRAAQGRLLIHSGPGVGTQVRIVLPRVAEEGAS